MMGFFTVDITSLLVSKLANTQASQSRDKREFLKVI